MCGITGLFSVKEKKDLELRINSMNDSIIHRGPDAGGFYVFKNLLALGHRRLSIIDISNQSNQPMHSNSGIWHIVFNGEIYNYKELKKELNYSFCTKSDTEVILAAVEEKGVDWFLDHANGMFAIALYNSKDDELFIIRDRLGIKPLYFYQDEAHFIFSSEIKAILESGIVKSEFNDLAVDEYLGNRYIRAPYTFFKNISQVEPGTYLKIDSDLNSSNIRYWSLPDEFNVSDKYDEAKIEDAFKDELEKAIKYRLMADVPLGTYLSGGVDSSFITAITALNTSEELNTYTIGFKELNEFEYATIVAEKYQTSHTEVLMSKNDYINNWERLIKYKDAPLGVPNEIPLAVMSSRLKEKITVVLSGEGADELMGGYGRIYRAPFDYENTQSSKSFYQYFIEQYEYVPRKLRDSFLNTSIKYRDEFDLKINADFSKQSNEQSVFKFFHEYHVRGLLQRVDMTTMQASVEARVPFLDHTLIEYVYSKVPYNLKLKWNNEIDRHKAAKLTSIDYSEDLDIPKYLLRKVSYKYLPKEIVERKKVGFPVPLTEWFDNLEELAKELLPNASWLKKGVFENLIEKSKKEVRAGQVLWMFINIELFKRNYFQKEWRW